MDTTKQAAMYARSATIHEGKEPSALISQITNCTQYATENGYQISKEHIYQEIVSGLSDNRPMLEAALQAAINGEFSTLFIQDYARLARNAVLLDTFLMQFAELGVTVIAITEPYPDLVLKYMADCIKSTLPTRTGRRKIVSHTTTENNNRTTSH
jgi:DNA invertase Pin-like site-specific DNA recombinase